jgi:hypothetical protein
MNNDNIKWQIAFWIINFVCGIWLLGLTNSVIANDRMRASEDNRLIELRVNSESKIEDRFECLLKENNSAHIEILTRLARIEQKLSNGNKY